MTHLLPLLRREWLQHRFAWAVMALLPTTLVLLLMSFGEVQIGPEDDRAQLPVAMALAAIGGGMGLHLLMLWIVAMIIVSGFARRDHGDRSIEFWLSLPTGNAESLAVPLFVHLLLVPIVALAVGLLGGLLASFVLVSRVAGSGAWLALPWTELIAGALAIFARLSVGVVLATLWLSPVILLTALMTAWFRRWGLVIVSLGLGVGTRVLAKVFGIHAPADALASLFINAGRSVARTSDGGLTINSAVDIAGAVGQIPQWALHDTGQALRLLASPLLVGGLLVAAGCFALLVQWRQRGADAGN